MRERVRLGLCDLPELVLTQIFRHVVNERVVKTAQKQVSYDYDAERSITVGSLSLVESTDRHAISDSNRTLSQFNDLRAVKHTCARFYQLIDDYPRFGLSKLNLSMRNRDLSRLHHYIDFLGTWPELRYISIGDYVPISQELFNKEGETKCCTVEDLYNLIGIRRNDVKQICIDMAERRQGERVLTCVKCLSNHLLAPVIMVASNSSKRTIITDFGIFTREHINYSCPIDKAPFNMAQLGLLNVGESVSRISGIKIKWMNAWLVSQMTLYTTRGRYFGPFGCTGDCTDPVDGETFDLDIDDMNKITFSTDDAISYKAAP